MKDEDVLLVLIVLYFVLYPGLVRETKREKERNDGTQFSAAIASCVSVKGQRFLMLCISVSCVTSPDIYPFPITTYNG